MAIRSHGVNVAGVITEVHHFVVADHGRRFNRPAGIVFPADAVGVAVHADQLAAIGLVHPNQADPDVDIAVRADHGRGQHLAGNMEFPSQFAVTMEPVQILVATGDDDRRIGGQGRSGIDEPVRLAQIGQMVPDVLPLSPPNSIA